MSTTSNLGQETKGEGSATTSSSVTSKVTIGDESAALKRSPKRPRIANDQDEPTAYTPKNNTSSNVRELATTNQPIQQSKELDSKMLQDIMCGSCIFCRMPRCERCFVCSVSNVQGQTKEERGCCLRKVCCHVPIEFKLQHTVGLGFPKGWRFAFDDPQKMSLVWGTKRILALAGLKVLSPRGEIFHSLESAFAHIPHSSISRATTMLENFLVHVGSSRYVSVPSHFLVGKSYCTEFTSNRGSNVVLFGKIAACMGPSGTDEDDKLFFILQYDQNVLSIAQSMGTEVQPLQLINSEMAWGGCISYERKSGSRRDSHSAIQNIDQATAAETWVAPDMRSEDMIEQPDGTSLPQLTVFARGYKFSFEVKASIRDGNQHYGVFASCTSLQETSSDQSLNLKPGELIDLGIFSPLREEDEKTLPAYIMKNYIHQLKTGRWAVVAGRDNIVYDITDDKTGELHDAASKRVLSYIRKCTKGERATIHARLDPSSGHVHYLFGIRYEGNWMEYESGMQELAPLFCGRTVEVTMSRQHGLGKKGAAGSKYLQSISMFQLEDILACNSQLAQMFDSEMIDQFPSTLIERSKEVMKCLEGRLKKLIGMFTTKSLGGDGSSKRGLDNDRLVSALEQSMKLIRMLEGHSK
mmetsp:Transcript_28887/g.61539  ORF Transcript_28887/g.61539 Transcript_28887/m.61539 type:complete len:638 (+) Transcript_28887:105-2018(+)